MERKEMCIIMHPYTCPGCGSNMLFFTINRSNTIIDYKQIMHDKNEDELKEYLADKNVEYLKCVMCKKSFIIDWTSGYARPLKYKNTLKRFGYKFKE